MRMITVPKKVPLSIFTPELILAVPQVPTDIAESYIRQAAIDLVEQAHCLKREIRIETQAGVSDYLLASGDGERVDSVPSRSDHRARSQGLCDLHRCGLLLRHRGAVARSHGYGAQAAARAGIHPREPRSLHDARRSHELRRGPHVGGGVDPKSYS